jgi:hypothetical protein
VVLLIWWLVQSEIWRTTLICNLNWFFSKITSGLVMFWKWVVFALCLFLYSILSAEWKTMSPMQLAKRKQYSINVDVVCSYLMSFVLSKSCARNVILFYMILLSYIMHRTYLNICYLNGFGQSAGCNFIIKYILNLLLFQHVSVQWLL